MDVSVIVPVYNSAQTLRPLFSRIKKSMEKEGYSFEVIFVEDGGQDGSWQVLEELKDQHPLDLQIIKLARNFGQHSATICGMTFAKGKWVVTIDDDLQTPPEEIVKLIEKQEETDADVVYGIYPQKGHSFVRNMGSWALGYIFKRFVTGIDGGTSFRLLRADLVKRICEHKQNFLYIDQILAWYTRDIAYVNVMHLKRTIGKSGYSIFKLIRLALRLLIQYTDLPLRLMTYTGFLASLISFMIGAVYIYKKLFLNVPLGFTSIIVSIFFTTGLILFCLGVLGEYISRIYTQRSDQPLYFIKKKK